MRRDELITKLAMEMPEWPSGLNRYQLDKIVSPIIPLDHYQGSVDDWGESEAYLYLLEWSITRYDYLAERERLINKPSWDDAPVWANYLCQQQAGVWCWYAYEPSLELNKWAARGGGLRLAGRGGRIPAGHNWKDTLEKRPEPMPGPVRPKWDGEGVPPVGTICEAKLDSDAWVEAEILAHYRPNAGGPEVAVFAYRRTPTSANRHVDQLIPEFFRPIRNEEDRAVEEMVDVVKGPAGEGESVRETVCRRLYRAGYRKPGGEE